jgi:hypothetical protein
MTEFKETPLRKDGRSASVWKQMLNVQLKNWATNSNREKS